MVYSTVFNLFNGKFSDVSKIINMINNPIDEQNGKNWSIFLTACDRYAEKTQMKKVPESLEILN